MALRITKPEINIREKLTELEGKADKSPAFLATGGTESVVDGYKYHTFTSSGTFTVISGSYTAQCLIVAGGAGGGGSHGGGGGAGGYRTNEEVMFGPTTYSVIVGAGGAQLASNGQGNPGGDSSLTLGNITSLGGGGGAATPSFQAPPAVSVPPAFNVVGASATNQLAGAIGSQSQTPIKAFVVANDVTTAQSLERNIIQGATIG